MVRLRANAHFEGEKKMFADKFYEQFKESLNFLGPGFRGMHLVTVNIKDDAVVLSFENKSVTIRTE